ncbi:hypothetical protein [Curtobacterium sp. MCSS17_015]|uniref:hypothetical protein n=1 Tax=Curtobacterium sp. MCSS17_015 TaxID=2175666 RepID=UPI000DA71088|nr:hypothetical protein [Curtobacterium sp. MCSS17_015]WIB25806.1 hypothetical protein DEJ18_12210 [Curtobacterium sp. MCSS17_015]
MYDDRGDRGRYIFAGSGASADAEDLTLLGEQIVAVGTRRVGTRDQRNALEAVWKFEGLEWFDTTDKQTYVLTNSNGWVSTIGDTGWITPTFLNDSMAGSGNQPTQYRRLNGETVMTGFWVPTADTEIQFRLPSGFRPKNTTRFWCDRGASNGPGAKIEIQSGTGSVIFRPSPAFGTGPVDYCQVRFPADQ